MKALDILDLDRMVNILQRRCEAQNVTLDWERNGSIPRTTGSRITLPLPKLPITEEEMTKLYGYGIHESGHHSRPDAFTILHKAKPGEELGTLFNIMEDDGMEREVALSHKGDAIALGAANKANLDLISGTWADNMPHWQVFTKEQVAPVVACTMGQLSRKSWDDVGDRDITSFVGDQHPKVLETVQELVNDGYLQRMLDTKNPFDTWSLACDMFKWFYPDRADEADKAERQRNGDPEPKDEPKDEPTKDCKSDDKSDDKGTPDGKPDGKPEDKVEGKSDDKPDEPDTQGKDKPSPVQQDEGQGGKSKTIEHDDGKDGTVVSWKEASFSDHDTWTPTGPNGPQGSVGIDWEGYSEGGVGLMPANLINVMDLRTKQFSPSSSIKGKPAKFMADNKSASMFGNKIRRYLQSQERTAVSRDKMHGRLDKGSIIKLALPPVDKGNWNRKLFYSKTERQGMDTCVLVLTDWSGSMKGTKMQFAADASGRLVHVFDRVLRVPVCLAAFSNARTKCDIGLIKSFNDHNIPPSAIAANFIKFFQFSRANNDSDALLWAYREILKRKEKRKIIMVLSDGAPAGFYYGSSSANLRAATKAVVKTGKVELHGIGIKSDAVKGYYPDYVVIRNLDEINTKLFEIIRQGDKRHDRQHSN